MRDVADAAGVSLATASRALSGSRPVRPETLTAVRAAADRLGYRTNHVARSLRRQSTQTVGMVVPRLANPFFPGLVQSLERTLLDQGHALVLCDADDDPGLEAERIVTLLDRRVDGLLVIPCDEHRSAAALRAAAQSVPVVQVDRRADSVAADAVTTDNAAGIAAALDHLRALGRNRTAYVGAAPASSPARERLATYRDLADGDVGDDRLLGDFSLDWGREAARRLLARRQLPDAIVCGNDLIALGVLRGLRAAGADVPADVAVTGFDDIGFAEVAEPALTTVRQPVDEIGATAVARLLQRIADGNTLAGTEDDPDPSPWQHLEIPPELVVRGSTVPGSGAA